MDGPTTAATASMLSQASSQPRIAGRTVSKSSTFLQWATPPQNSIPSRPSPLGEYYRAIFNNNDLYTLTVELRDAGGAVIASFETGTITATTSAWTWAGTTFANYGEGVRQIYIRDGGKDTGIGQVIMVHGWMVWRSGSPSTQPHHAAETAPAK